MQKAFASNYLKIYVWQGISFVLNVLSMVIVVPFLTKDPMVYGIYSVCISVTIFLAYADVGFISAGIKYAAELYSRNDRLNEIKVIGFTNFVLLVFLILFSMLFLMLSFHPDYLIKDVNIEQGYSIASSLLLIVSIFTPVTLLNRMLQMIFGIRIEDYIMQRVNIVTNIAKISSVFYFFSSESYDIVGYFLFCQSANLLASLVSLTIAKRRYHYDMGLLFKSLRYDRIIFTQTRSLAFSSLYVAITWILYYELDNVAIGKYYGAERVAVYAVSLTILSVFRNIFGILFSPFGARFNHFVGMKDYTGLKAFYFQIINYLAPVVVLPILTISLLARPMILSWVGINYSDSVLVTEILVLCNIFAFISYPAGLLLIAQLRIREMNVINSLIPFIYWFGIAFSIKYLGLVSFATFKFLAFAVAAVYYLRITKSFLGLNFRELFKKIFVPLVFPVLFVIFVSLVVRGFLPIEKSRFNLAMVLSAISMIVFFGLTIQLLSSTLWREKVFSILRSLKV